MKDQLIIKARGGDVTIKDPALFKQASEGLARLLESGIPVYLTFERRDGETRLMRATRQGMIPWTWDGKSLFIPVRDLAIKDGHSMRAFRFDRLMNFRVDVGELAG